jgi:hypothetical protein
MTAVFRSKIDRWIVVVLGSATLLSLAVSIVVAVVSPSATEKALVLGGWGALTAAVVWLLRSTRYLVEDTRLLVRSGPFSWRIPYDRIEAVVPSTSPLSAPALSLDRLEIRGTGSRSLLVSPRDREGFLAALLARCPHLVRVGPVLRRPPASGT